MKFVIKYFLEFQYLFLVLLEVTFIWTCVERIRNIHRDQEYLDSLLSEHIKYHNQSERRIHYAKRMVKASLVYSIVCLGLSLLSLIKPEYTVLAMSLITMCNTLAWHSYWRLRNDTKLD